MTALALVPAFLLSLAILAPAIRLTSKGPVFYRQKRIGFRGRTFTVYKYRTMEVGGVDLAREGSAEGLRVQTGSNAANPRVTRVGQWLRRHRIDELPQILNVLRGEMSMIGPRPEEVDRSEYFGEVLPYYRYRHIVKPGLTGWAQVNQGHVMETDDTLEKLHYDFYYIKHLSLWLDMLIVIKTARIVLTGHGSK